MYNVYMSINYTICSKFFCLEATILCLCFSQLKISSYQDRYGNDPESWPLAQSVVTQPDSGSHSNSSGADDESDSISRPHPLTGQRSFPTVTEGERQDKDESGSTSNQHMEISWQVIIRNVYTEVLSVRFTSSYIEKWAFSYVRMLHRPNTYRYN